VNRRPVTSSHIASIGFDDGEMEVEFLSGHLHLYHDVPEAEYQALLGADSIGKHFHQIKSRYQSTKLK
jgi:hypothetical protein